VYGPLTPDVDGDKLLRAIAAVETSGGKNNWPRLETAWIPKGLAFTVQGHLVTGTGTSMSPIASLRWQKWGLESAASWGWWQILYHTAADLGFTGAPHELFDPSVSELWVWKRLKSIAYKGGTTVEQFADAWNSGNFKDTIIPTQYIANVKGFYEAA
jgi:hypothetical protein